MALRGGWWCMAEVAMFMACCIARQHAGPSTPGKAYETLLRILCAKSIIPALLLSLRLGPDQSRSPQLQSKEISTKQTLNIADYLLMQLLTALTCGSRE